MMNTVSWSHDDHKSPDLPIALYPNRMRKGNGGLTYYAANCDRLKDEAVAQSPPPHILDASAKKK